MLLTREHCVPFRPAATDAGAPNRTLTRALCDSGQRGSRRSEARQHGQAGAGSAGATHPQAAPEALVSMMIEKGYDGTTVQDIVDRANVGRATFYAHFADKETLLVSRLEDLRAMLAQQQQQALTT